MSRTARIAAAATLALAMASAARAQVLDPTSQLPARPEASTLRGDFTFAAVGDFIAWNPVMAQGEPEFGKLAKVLQSADVAFGNQETPIFDLKSFDGQRDLYTRLQGPASLAADERAMGIDLVSTSNNHAGDWGPSGLLSMQKALDEAGIAYAGSGRSLTEAHAPVFIDTAKGRVALVATASTFTPYSQASDALGYAPARTGISMLRTRRVTLVSAEEMATLRSILQRHSVGRFKPPAPDATQINLFGATYRVSDKRGLTYEMDPTDHFEILKAVRGAKQLADFVVFGIHAHESPTGMDDDNPTPPDFLVQLFHETVDAGADVVVGGGPHALRGVEIYKGKPIFYGVGVFILQGNMIVSPEGFEDSKLDPRAATIGDFKRAGYGENNPKAWYDGLVTSTTYRDGKLAEVRLYPTDLAVVQSAKGRGIPRLAGPARATEILETLRAASAPFGTKIDIEGGVGVIRVAG